MSSPLLMARLPVPVEDDAATLVDSPLEVDDVVSNDRAYDYDDDDDKTMVAMTLETMICDDKHTMARISHLLGMQRVSWLTLARLLANFTRYSQDLLDDEAFKDFLMKMIVGVRVCTHSYAKNGYKTFLKYYTKMVCDDMPNNVTISAKVHNLSLEDACLRVLDFSRRRFDYEWKRDHGKVCP